MRSTRQNILRWLGLGVGMVLPFCWGSASASPPEPSTTELLQELKLLRAEVEKRKEQLQSEMLLLQQQEEELTQRKALMQEIALASSELAQYDQAAPLVAPSLPGTSLLQGAGEGQAQVPQPAPAVSQNPLPASKNAEAAGNSLPVQSAPGSGLPQLAPDKPPPPKDPGFRLTGQLRTRFERNDADFDLGQADQSQLFRTRLNLTVHPAEKLDLLLQAQDHRLWGSELNTMDGAGDNIDLHQAHLTWAFSPRLRLTLGRQEFNYGAQRLVGAVDWSNAGRSFDALKMRYGGASYVDLFDAKLREKGDRDYNFYGLYAHLHGERNQAEPYLFFERNAATGADSLRRFTSGLRLQGQLAGGLGYELEGAYQFGELPAADIGAFMATTALRFTGSGPAQPSFSLGADWLSGDGDPADGKYKVFDTLFATNHKFYGFMDYFINIPKDTGQRGLLDLMLKGQAKVSPTLKVSLDFHHFALATGTQKKLGQELDAILNYWYHPALALQGGLLLFLPGEAMKASRGDELAIKHYLQISADF